MNTSHKDLRKKLKLLGIKNAIVGNATSEGYPAIILRWNGTEEFYTGNDEPGYKNWLIEKFADNNLE